MKTNLPPLCRCLAVWLVVSVLHNAPAPAAVFTSDTTIGVDDTTYDGADILITNCAVTVDGPHTFNTLQVRNGGTLTHTQIGFGSGVFLFSGSVTGEVHVLSSASPATLSDSNAVINTVVVRDQTGTITYTNGLDYTVTRPSSFVVIDLIPGTSIPDGGTILVDYDTLRVVPSGLDLSITGDASIESGGAINVNARGFSGGLGVGPGFAQPGSGSGAGYGGYGGRGSSNDFGGTAYGSILQPIDKGSGGGDSQSGAGGGGGGAVHLAVGGLLQIHGSISANAANATNSRAGGGAGGSIWLQAQTVTGAGSLSAEGGAGEPIHGGGGGGGRIAIYAGTNLFSGSVLARGGTGFVIGGAGTVYTRDTNQPVGQVVVDNGGRSGTNTFFTSTEAVGLTVQGGAIVSPAAATGSGIQGLSSLLVASNGWLASLPSPLFVNLAVSGQATIQAGGGILADGKGFPGGQGTGAGPTANVGGGMGLVGGGGGYGGFGGAAGVGAMGGISYGSFSNPTDLGSGGGSGNGLNPLGGTGGGVIQLTVFGSLILDGKISAGGNSAAASNSGGGSGGSVMLTVVGSLNGTGTILANGGTGNGLGGGGGGGRISISYGITNTFTGTVAAYGGGGGSSGGAGTIIRKRDSISDGATEIVIVDNGGRTGALTGLGTGSIASSDLSIIGGAWLTLPPMSFSIRSLLISSNSTMFVTNVQATTITISSNATIQAGGWIRGDGDKGSPGGAGNGTSFTSPTYGLTGGGGGHGGQGSASLGGAGGGVAFDSATQPVQRGGNGAPIDVTGQQGGVGGAAVRLNVIGNLLVDGKISADGHDGNSLHGGGGAGGSLWITANALSGAGVISAKGGRGNGVGGSGGGGRIAVTFTTNNFVGTMVAQGGGNANFAGAGTIFTKANIQQVGLFTIDNGGASGAATLLSPLGADVTLSAGARMISDDQGPNIRSLLIKSNSWLLVSNRNLSLAVSSNAMIQAGGGISANGTGFTGGFGQGAGRIVTAGQLVYGSGAGHGGLGGNSFGGATGGNAYDSILDPIMTGSGGGGTSVGGPPNGGSGGGLIRLTITRDLHLDGVISANGLTGTGANSGGGSGGGIRVNVGGFFGSGRISVDGGAGAASGGGGAGGRAAIYCASNAFSGLVSAFGGSGFVQGGAGTVFFQVIDRLPVTQVILDNGGLLGATTPFSGNQGSDVTVRNGAIAAVTVPQLSVRSLFIGSNAFLIATNLNSLVASSNVTIALGGVMTADGNGAPAGSGPGFGRSSGSTGSGGGYGGAGGSSSGGAIGGSIYGSILPTQTGSGGGSSNPGSPIGAGNGGGFILMSVTGTLNVDGLLTANGSFATNSNSGGGSGGGINLSVGRFSGSGRVSANGGAGIGSGGGGGGGRIAVVYGTNTYTGVLSAFGGSGFVFGGAGTVFLRAQNQSVGQLTLDNGGIRGALSSFSGDTGSMDVTMKSGVMVSLSSSLPPLPGPNSIRNLLISSNAWLVVSNTGNLIVADATLEPGGGITADGTGSPAGTGLGAGHTIAVSSTISGSGGGHGGLGVDSSGGAPGGITYGSLTLSLNAGSGGGSGSGAGTNALGGAGGGALRLTVTGNLQINGNVSANAMAGLGLNSGGGSGGSITLTVGGTLSGSGKITANGGAGNGPGGGGGGGGRIALSFATNNFSGVMSAYGGSGNGWGGAGTIFLAPSKVPPTQQLIVDNGGPSGVSSPLPSVNGTIDLIIKGGAAASPSGPVVIHGLTIASNSWLIASNVTPQVTMTITGDATIQAGGGIKGDGVAQSSGQGAGGTLFLTGGGGGHGGIGSMSGLGAAGGASYDSITSPNFSGSRGGSGLLGGSPGGGAGGGALALSVSGTLNVDGRISLDGISTPNPNGGGGSGGSFSLTTAGLLGTGIISANGGEGNGLGGGGGGGRIAFVYQSNNFSGTIVARGASGGLGAGGAGTIYTRAANQSIGQLLVDNAGLPGADTPVANIGVLNLTVGGGAAVYPSNPFMVLSNLFVDDGGLVVSAPGQANLELTILSNVVIEAGGVIGVDGQGFAQSDGPGAGQSLNGYGSGGGYGGMGGSSWTTFGGFPYGAATQPVDRGSGGGFGAGPIYAVGSQGGGAIRLNIGGTITVDGSLSANGYPALQDGAGGGSGGSIWVIARTVRGDGSISADGGTGELFGGGGGSGGRIAIYYLTNPGHTNNFTGAMTAFGGEGEYWGDDGSVFFSAGLPALQGISHTPVGTVSNVVNTIDVVFNAAVLSFSASSADMVLNTPNGPLLSNLMTVSALSPYSLRITFPQQTAVGNYSFNLGPQITDLFGRPMAQAYTGAFAVLLPMIQGTVTETNGQPVPGVILQSSDALSFTTSDANGNYALGFVTGSSFTVTPTLNGFMFAPGSRAYSNVVASVTGQDYLMVTTIAPDLAIGLQETNLITSWLALPGVTYQVYCSTNLIDWLPYGAPIVGSNSPVQMPVPTEDVPEKFLRVEANN